jgi:hypothetical protein
MTQKYIRYKGKGEHSIIVLEEIIEQREEEIHQLKLKNMEQKTQTLFIYPDGSVAKRIDDFLYHPITNTIYINGDIWKIRKTEDEFDTEDWLVRRIHLTK